MLAKNRVVITLIVAVLMAVAGIAAIFWARGFKPDFKNGRIDRTGLIVASSIPTGAQVYLDDRLTSATDTNIAFLDPKTYKVKIQKDGYTTWEKEIEVKADLATEIKVVLFPLAPEIKPLTTTGAANPTLSPDGTEIIYGTTGERGGLWQLPMSDRPFPFRQDATLLARNTAAFDYSKAIFTWSPNSKQAIASFRGPDGTNTANIMIEADKGSQELRDVTGSLTSIFSGWQQELDTRAQTLALTVPDVVKNATAEAGLNNLTDQQPNNPKTQTNNLITQKPNNLNYYPTGLSFSPDDEKVFFRNRDNKFKIYDLKTKKEYTLPDYSDLINISWFPDSAHIVVAQKDSVSIVEIDGTNKMTIYSGKFEDSFIFAHPSGARLIVLTALTQPDGTLPNLYSINLR